ncbi:DUF6429 family protein [Brevifollis gellanilyticus]|uniref:DUF6429 domain-containing protein n=1 Tax=Brevifollis gellanilyticus TaxID=748831 RepID=A0A512M6J3_9BACT|nr:DUF6429 family protein [Brevifollis gellanilyticus]GEP42344.1 hypothetical protein BGE01nite_16350 [Brevifollis gellanilyticus]
MKPDHDKIDDAVLALLHLGSSQSNMEEQYGTATAWKSHDWDALSRLHEKGLISDPVNKNKSIALTEEGLRRSRELFEQLFCKS